MRLLLTGATGFVGSEVIKQLLAEDIDVIAAVRTDDSILPVGVQRFLASDLSEPIDWLSALVDVDVVIHLAARVHVMNDSAVDPLTEFRKVNTAGTLNLARQSADAGVKRFIFLSSIGVNGNNNYQSFSESDRPSPQEPYAISKCEAEKDLLSLAEEIEIEMEVLIIRPPLVYGPKAPGNFDSLMKWVNKGVPLPLGSINNQRSFVALDNLVGFIIHCIHHPKAANEIFLISDGEDVSTTELLQKVVNAFGKKSRLLPVPVWLMTIAAKLIGKGGVANRLFGTLQIDSSKARDLLGWKSVITMDEQLKKTADAYLEKEKSL